MWQEETVKAVMSVENKQTTQDPCETLAQLRGLTHGSFSDEASRYRALHEAQQLVRRLETPTDAAIRMMWIDPAINISFKVCSDLGVFQELLTGPKKTDELARAVSADPSLLRRFLRQLAAASYLEELDVDMWKSTEMTAAMASGLSATGDFLFDIGLPAYRAAPSTLKADSWQSPNDRSKGPWQQGHGTDQAFFDWLANNTESSTAFNNTMRVTQLRRIPWFEIYPVRDRLFSRFDSSVSDVLLVDVGGNIGHDLEGFHKSFPDHPGTLVLQDLDRVVTKANLDPSIKTQSQSFFEPQPIKGAAAYFMGSILHDWPDRESRQILSHLRDAMKPGYSRILLREPVLPAKGATLMNTSMDLIMMTLLSAKERTRRDWEELATSTGLTVSGTWEDPSGFRHIIEMVLQDDVVG